MIIMAFFSWWYGPGWANEVSRVKAKIAGVTDTFSVTLLLATLFSPFRQISAGSVNGPLDAMVRAWFDSLISRLIGAFVRSIMIVMGIVSLAGIALFGAILLIVWPILPFVPLLALLAMLLGWVPQWTA